MLLSVYICLCGIPSIELQLGIRELDQAVYVVAWQRKTLEGIWFFPSHRQIALSYFPEAPSVCKSFLIMQSSLCSGWSGHSLDRQREGECHEQAAQGAPRHSSWGKKKVLILLEIFHFSSIPILFCSQRHPDSCRRWATCPRSHRPWSFELR